MNLPAMFDPIRIDGSTHVMPAYIPVPGFGILPVNASLILGAEPVLVDTGLSALRDDFLVRLENLVDPHSLRWIWITHMDPDHVGNLEAVLEIAPTARVITTYLGMGKLGLLGIPQDRVYLLNPGQELELPDRTLACLRPPSFDAPETTALFDQRSSHLFSADGFGALMDAPEHSADRIPADQLREGLVTWATVDSPWLQWVEEKRFREHLRQIRNLSPTRILSSHLPPSERTSESLFEYLEAALHARPFLGPSHAALDALASA